MEERLKLTLEGERGAAAASCPAEPDLRATLWPFWSASRPLSLSMLTAKEEDKEVVILTPLPPGSAVSARSFSVSWASAGGAPPPPSPKLDLRKSVSVLMAMFKFLVASNQIRKSVTFKINLKMI